MSDEDLMIGQVRRWFKEEDADRGKFFLVLRSDVNAPGVVHILQEGRLCSWTATTLSRWSEPVGEGPTVV